MHFWFDHFCLIDISATQCLSASQPQELYTDLDQDDPPDSEEDEPDPDQEETLQYMAQPVGVPEVDDPVPEVEVPVPEVEVPLTSTTASIEQQILAKRVQLAEVIDLENQESQTDIRQTIAIMEARIEVLKSKLDNADDKPSLGFEL